MCSNLTVDIGMPSKSTSPTCAELEKLHAAKNVIGVLNHSKFACQDCAKKRLYNKFDGEELLFKTALPPWLIPPPSEQISDQPIKAVDKKKRNIPAKGKPIICPEDVDEHLYKRSYELSDSALIYEITKLKHVDKEVALSIMIDLRKRKKEEESRKREEKALEPNENGNECQGTEMKINRPNMLPWCPELKHLFPRGETSVLNQGAQTRFLAICQNLMNTGEARFQSNLKELKAFELKAEKERKFMEERIVEQTISSFEQDDAIVRKHPLAALKNRAAPFIIQRWNRHWIGDNGRFNRSPQTIFDWSSETKIASAFNTPELETVLQRGRADKIDLPSLRNRCPLMDNSVFEQFLPETSEENTIFEDENIIPLSLENGIKFAIEATTCCHLMADSFIGKSQNYAIPITVSQHIYSGSFHSLIVIGKPRVLGAVNNATIMRQFIKYQIKSNFVKRTLQIESSLRQESTSLVTECSPSEKKNDVTEPSPSKKNNNITESCQPEVEKNSDMEENTDNDFSDPLDSILDKIIPTPLTASSKPRASESGKQYSLFNANGLRFLVRSRPAPNCSVGPLFVQGKPLSIQPKIEYAPVAGAMCLGSEEWIWNYAKETFKQTNNHCLFRVHHDGNNVLQLQHSEPRHSNREHPCSPHVTRSTTNRRCLDNEKKELISSRTDRFTQLLENLTKLSHGRYLLLNESDGKLKLLAETNENDAATDVLDCSTIAKSVVLSREVPKFRDIFEGLESRIPLQWQIVQRRAPGCFVAKDSKLHFIAITPLEENIKERKSIKRTGYQKRKGMKRRRYNKD